MQIKWWGIYKAGWRLKGYRTSTSDWIAYLTFTVTETWLSLMKRKSLSKLACVFGQSENMLCIRHYIFCEIWCIRFDLFTKQNLPNKSGRNTGTYGSESVQSLIDNSFRDLWVMIKTFESSLKPWIWMWVLDYVWSALDCWEKLLDFDPLLDTET